MRILCRNYNLISHQSSYRKSTMTAPLSGDSLVQQTAEQELLGGHNVDPAGGSRLLGGSKKPRSELSSVSSWAAAFLK